MKLGIVLAGVLRTQIDFADLCKWAATNGYQAIDVPADREDGGEIARAAGLEPAALSVGAMPELFLADERARKRAVEEGMTRLDAAAHGGLRFVQLSHRRVPDAPDQATIEAARATLVPLCARAEQLGVKLVFENYAAAGRNFMISPANWRRVFEAVPSPALGLCFDPSHLVQLGVDWLRALREFGAYIQYAHAKDTELNPEALYQHGYYGPDFGQAAGYGRIASLGPNAQGWWRFTLPGFGTIDWGRYIGALREVGFDGNISVEHEDDAWGWRSDVDRTLEGLTVARKYLSQFLWADPRP